ncbi:hypothetical protein [Metabacillus fastidiosus]|uniref:Uncharacterized protein n=1 Tax=Metabacillus fastidiosus TaxID=1458 RepID=A0ABU6NT83_9BACI|nr:hypothetical protein [Metabacillus fastidiosus]
MFTNLAVWFLRKRKASVLINIKLNGGTAQQLTRNGFIYDCEFNDNKYLLENGRTFDIPEGKFKVRC